MSMRRTVKCLLGPLFRRLGSRRLGLWMELVFWRRWLSREGGEMSELFRRELDPSAPIDAALHRYLEGPSDQPARILDVGAGPMTILGKTHPTRRLEIVATDVLAAQYARYLRRYGITPPVPTIPADAERLSEALPAGTFDLVHANNCLDHTAEPGRALAEMVGMARPGGWVYLRHRRDEAEREHYSGLHQWNVCERDGELVIWRPGEEISARDGIGQGHSIACWSDGEHVIAEIRRRA